MRLLREIKVRARQALPQVLAACMVAYFAYHALHGDRGFYAWIMLKQERAQVMAAAEEVAAHRARLAHRRSEEHTSELQSLMRISYAVFCLKKKNTLKTHRPDCTKTKPPDS